jgi:vacuolar-type H+-ATPase subunit E/Vma4
MGTIPLENSIREESENTIRAIREKESSEIERLEEAFAAEREEFRTKIDNETDARIRQELSRLENKGILERRKMKLRSMDSFINEIVDETVKGLRNTTHYKKFLFDAICDVTGRIQGRAEVCLNKEDLVHEQEIMAAVRAVHRDPDIVFKNDPAIRWGGCIIHDDQGGRIFNSTLERICFRKSTVIRHESMKALLGKGKDVGGKR